MRSGRLGRKRREFRPELHDDSGSFRYNDTIVVCFDISDGTAIPREGRAARALGWRCARDLPNIDGCAGAPAHANVLGSRRANR